MLIINNHNVLHNPRNRNLYVIITNPRSMVTPTPISGFVCIWFVFLWVLCMLHLYNDCIHWWCIHWLSCITCGIYRALYTVQQEPTGQNLYPRPRPKFEILPGVITAGDFCFEKCSNFAHKRPPPVPNIAKIEYLMEILKIQSIYRLFGQKSNC
jgi:hypothetical protein